MDLLKDVVTWKASQHFDHVLAMETCRPMPEGTDETVESYSVLMETKGAGEQFCWKKKHFVYNERHQQHSVQDSQIGRVVEVSAGSF